MMNRKDLKVRREGLTKFVDREYLIVVQDE